MARESRALERREDARRQPGGRAASIAANLNGTLILGILILGSLVAFSLLGQLLIPESQAYPLAGPPGLAPSAQFPFGTDSEGRDILAATVYGTFASLKVGVFAAAIGVIFGAVLGLFAGYFGGKVDTIAMTFTDVFFTIPKLLVLVVVASSLSGTLTTNAMALIVSLFSWPQPARQIRSQVLSLRERDYLRIARMNGMNSLEIIFWEILPNLLPYLSASFVLATSTAILATVGLEALGLGPAREATLGMMIHWLIYYAAFLQGMWWWFAAPVTCLIMVFLGLYLISVGLDRVANPRLQTRVRA